VWAGRWRPISITLLYSIGPDARSHSVDELMRRRQRPTQRRAAHSSCVDVEPLEVPAPAPCPYPLLRCVASRRVAGCPWPPDAGIEEYIEVVSLFLHWLVRIAIQALFSWQKFSFLATVALSFLFDKHYPNKE